MLTYSIRPHTAPHREVLPKDYLSRNNILARQLERCKVKLGDWVRPTTGKNAGHVGLVVELESDPSKIEWKKGGKQPYFVRVQFGTFDTVTKLAKGVEVLYFPVKQLRHAR